MRLMLASLALIAGMAFSPAAFAGFPGDNGRLAYTSFSSATNSSQTCTRNPDGTGLQCFSIGHDAQVTWSPLGTRLALAPAFWNITTVDPDGTNATQLTSFDNGFTEQPAWSPDGQRIAFAHQDEPYPFCEDNEDCPTTDVWVMNADGSDQRVRWGGDVTDPAWSPDGTKLAIVVFSGPQNLIYLVPTEGSGSPQFVHEGRDPNWSPDGAWITFVSSLDGSTDIYKVRRDGSDFTRLTDDDATVANASPVWSPDGTKIAFTSNSLSAPRSFPARVDAVDADGTGRSTLFGTSTTDFINSVDWQPLLRGYPRPKGATPTRVPLVPAAKPCTSPDSTHGAPLSHGSCSPPVPESATTFVGIGDGNPAPAKSVGSVQLKALGITGPPDDADVGIETRITNVMHTSDRSDYTGELRLELPLRITDRFNAPHPNVTGPGTVADTSFFATVPCTATADPTLGAACTLSSTTDAILPGAAREGARAVWGLGQVRLHDGGPDGDAETAADNGLLAVQGLFIP